MIEAAHTLDAGETRLAPSSRAPQGGWPRALASTTREISTTGISPRSTVPEFEMLIRRVGGDGGGPTKGNGSPRPLFHVASKAAREDFLGGFLAFQTQYQIASEAFRRGNRSAAGLFPEGCFPEDEPPGLHWAGPQTRLGCGGSAIEILSRRSRASFFGNPRAFRARFR